MSEGAICNLSKFEMCSHNGTHIDAPKHFFDNGKSIDEINLKKFVGWAHVVEHSGELTGIQAEDIINSIKEKHSSEVDLLKLLFKRKSGDKSDKNTVITIEAARVLNKYGIELVGVESQTVGSEDATAEVHCELLGQEVVLLEGLVLSEVPEGVYFLSAAPLKLGGSDGAPCRAVLVEGLDA